MNFINIFFIFLLFFIDISCTSLGIKLLTNLFNYSLDILNLTLLFEKDFSSCLSSLVGVFGNKNPNLYSKVFRYTGKRIGHDRPLLSHSQSREGFSFRIHREEVAVRSSILAQGRSLRFSRVLVGFLSLHLPQSREP